MYSPTSYKYGVALEESTEYISDACIPYLVYTLDAKGNVDSVKGLPLLRRKVRSFLDFIVAVILIDIFLALRAGGEVFGIGIGSQTGLEVICISDFEEDKRFVVLGQTGPMLRTDVSMNFPTSKVYSEYSPYQILPWML